MRTCYHSWHLLRAYAKGVGHGTMKFISNNIAGTKENLFVGF